MGSKADHAEIIRLTILSLALVSLSLWLQGNVGFDMFDEGFVWYGAIETSLGKVPIRDFQSYDPFRYYWAAAWSHLFGNGIVALRISAYIFLAVCLPFGLFAARRAARSFPALAVVGLLMLIWAQPAFKVFDIAISLVTIFFAVRLVERPTYFRHFAAGLFVGFSAFIGRNHGLYGFLAFLTLILLLWSKTERHGLAKKLGIWAGGISIGYLPMIFMILFIPGFFARFMDSVLLFVRLGSTNLPLPVPWPWRFDYSGLGFTKGLFALSQGSLFLIMPLFYLFALITIILTSREDIPGRALFIASTLVGIFYMHYAFSRAHIVHLAHGMPPLILALASVPASFSLSHKRAAFIGITGMVSVMTFFTVAILSPFGLMARNRFVAYNVREDRMWIPEGQAKYLASVKDFVDGKVRPEEGLLITFFPGLYCMLEKESPLRLVYFLFPEPEENQKKMVLELREKDIRWALFSDANLQGEEKQRFRFTHTLVWLYLMEEFDSAPVPGTELELLHKREADRTAARNSYGHHIQ